MKLLAIVSQFLGTNISMKRGKLMNHGLLISIAIILMLNICPSLSFADFWDGYKLKEFSDAALRIDNGRTQPLDGDKSGSYRGYVIGIHDSLENLYICAPTSVKVGQLLAIVDKYLRDNPDKWNYGGSKLVSTALSAVFPCNK